MAGSEKQIENHKRNAKIYWWLPGLQVAVGAAARSLPCRFFRAPFSGRFFTRTPMKCLPILLTLALITGGSLLFAEEAEKKEPAPTKPAEEAKPDDGAKKADEFQAYEGEITAKRVNIRSGPSTNYRSLMRAKQGFGVLVVGDAGDWLKIAVPTECLLWIHKNFVKLSDNGESGTVTADKVNVRMAPEPEADIVGQVNTGAELEVTGGEGEWLEIAAPPTTCAYVHKDYVKRVEAKQQ